MRSKTFLSSPFVARPLTQTWVTFAGTILLTLGSFGFLSSNTFAQDPPNAMGIIRADEHNGPPGGPPPVETTVIQSPHKTTVIQTEEEEKTALDLFGGEVSYVGSSKIRSPRYFPTRGYGNQDVIHQNYEYAHRFLIYGDRTYFRLGAAYDRYDFGKSEAPVPTLLQSLSLEWGVEYVVQNHPAIFLRSNPGVYCSRFDNHVDWGSVDIPTEIGLVFPAMKDFYVLVGARASLLWDWPLIPLAGVVWVFNDNWRLEAVPPRPSLIYAYSENLEFFAGVEFVGSAFKTGKQHYSSIRPDEQRLSNGVVNYTETRAVAGFTWKVGKFFSTDLSGGWDAQREFRYFRSHGRHYDTFGAPFGKFALSAEF